MKTIGDRLKHARETRGLKQVDLAKLAGVSQSTIGNVESGIRERPRSLIEIAKALDVNVDWLLTGRGDMGHRADGEAIAFTEEDESLWANVRGYPQAVGLGSGAEAEEYAEVNKLKFKSSSLKKKGLRPHNLAVFIGRGDSMLPDIKHGDAIMFDEHDTSPRDGEIYVVRVDTEYQLKKALVLDNVIYFCATNPDGDHHWKKPRRMDDRRNPILVVGRALWIGRWLS